MNCNNFDLVFIQRLTSLQPMYEVIRMQRIASDEPMTMTSEIYGKLLKNFLSDKEFKKTLDELSIPLQVTDAISSITSKHDIIINDIENFLSAVKYHGYEFFIVGRLDVKTPTPEIDMDFMYRSYLLDNFSNNTASISAYYVGYSIVTPGDTAPYAVEYLDVFGMDNTNLESYDLLTSQNSYNILKSQGKLSVFDDSNSFKFIESRGMKYKLLINKL